MRLYAILRRGGWATPDELRQAAARSTAERERMLDDVAWLRSYVTAEPDGTMGTICIHQATSPEAIRLHLQPRRPAGRRDREGDRHRDRPADPALIAT
jgi:hypothetical protein